MCLIESKAFDMLFTRKNNNFIGANGKPSKMSLRLMNPHFTDMVANKLEYMDIMSKKSFEKLETTSKMGYKLSAKLYKAENPNGITVICIHGYQSNGLRDYAHIGYNYLKNNYNILLVDNCAAGESEGDYITFGVRESADGAEWVKKINELYPDSKIVLQGCSLGGATVCNMSAMDLKNVIAIIADCPFTSPKAEYMGLAKSFTGLKFKCLINSLERYAYKKAGFDFSTITPINSVKKSKYPILFIHGKDDHFIDCSAQDELYNACTSKKEKLTYDDAGHCGSQLKPGYFDEIYKFINKNA